MRISSNQSGAITASKNLVDFDLPPMVYDLSKSYMVIHSSIETTDTNLVASGNASGGEGIYNCFLNYKQDTEVTHNFKNKSLVKNISMYSQKEGMIEDIKRSDVLQYNLDQYRDDIDTKVNSSYNQISSLFGANSTKGIRWSPHRRFSPLGTESSDNLDREIRIGLSEVMNSCNNIYDGVRFGSTRVHAELNIKQLEVAESLGFADTEGLWAAADGALGGDFGLARGVIKDDTTVGTDRIVIQTARAYVNPDEDSPFYVGQKITVTAGTVGTGGGNARTDYVRQIVEIEHDPTTRHLKLTLDLTLGVGAIASVVIKGCDSATKVVNFDSAELVLYVTDKAPPPMIAFATYKLEEDSFTGTNYNHQYYLESDVQNVFWGSRTKDDVLGFDNAMTSYRFREAGVDKTDRDVKYGSSVHFNRVSRTFGNSNMKIKNLSEAEMQNNNTVSGLLQETAGTDDQPLFLIGETCQITEMPKLLDVNIAGTFGNSNICLFKQMMKTL